MQPYTPRNGYAMRYVDYARTINTYLQSSDYFFVIAERQAGNMGLNDMEPEKRMEALFRFAGKYFSDMQRLAHDAALALMKIAIDNEQHDAKLAIQTLNEVAKTNASVLTSYISAATKVNTYSITADRFVASQQSFISVSSATIEQCYDLMAKAGKKYYSQGRMYRSSTDWNARYTVTGMTNNIPV